VLPDACIDIVFVNDELPVVVGPYMESFIARLPPGTNIIGARFHPGRAFGFLRHPASALLNQAVPVDALWNKAAHSDFVSLVCEGTGVVGRLAALETALMRCLPRAGSIDLAVAAGIKWLADHPEARVEQLSDRIGISNRQFRRRFSTAVGYCPKMFQQVLRFQYLLNRATHVQGRPRLADLSADAGYADQAHMTREVRRFSDVSPAELLGSARCTLRLSGLIKTEPSL
jgi:AraC-like DNA-binding protein